MEENAYEKGYEKANAVMRVINRIRGGESETRACAAENVNKSWFRRFVREDLSDISREADRVSVTRDTWITWEDQFLSDLVGEDYDAPENFLENYDNVTSRALSEQEQEILRLFYQEEMNFAQIGAIIGRTRERVRIIQAKIMRKLRNPNNRLELLYGKDYVKVVKVLHDAQAEYDKKYLHKKEERMEEKQKKITDLKIKTKQLQERIENREQAAAYGKLTDLDLSVRSYNALARYFMLYEHKYSTDVTIYDILRISSKLGGIRNIGKQSEKEILDKIKEFELPENIR